MIARQLFFKPGRYSRLFRDRRGVAMVEFAFVLPVILIMYLGSVQLTNALACQRKLGAMSRFVADMVSRTIVTDAREIEGIFGAAQVIMAPCVGTDLMIRVSALQSDKNNRTSVLWSKAMNGAAHRRTTPMILPTGLMEKERSLIFVQTYFDFRAAGPFRLPARIRLADILYMAPRQSRAVTCQDCF